MRYHRSDKATDNRQIYDTDVIITSTLTLRSTVARVCTESRSVSFNFHVIDTGRSPLTVDVAWEIVTDAEDQFKHAELRTLYELPGPTAVPKENRARGNNKPGSSNYYAPRHTWWARETGLLAGRPHCSAPTATSTRRQLSTGSASGLGLSQEVVDARPACKTRISCR